MNFLRLGVFLATILSSAVFAAEHTVEMKNSGKEGIMLFEPSVLTVNVGDTVHFVPSDFAHNSASIEGLTPNGSVTWVGEVSKKVSVTIDKEGIYVYQCDPHSVMAMVGVIVAGEPTNKDDIFNKAVKYSENFVANKERLINYLSKIK